jgi:DNA-binding NarL/FixJ family response regulator
VNSPDHRIRVVIVDDHHFFREGLRGTLEANGMVVVGEARGGLEAVALARELVPDVLVIDLSMPHGSGVEAIERIAATQRSIQIVVLTVSSAGEDVIAALHAGASSYLLKDATLDDLVGGIRQAARGDAVLSHEIAQTLVAHVRAGEPEVTSNAGAGVPLTTRETEVLRLIVGGADNASIGRELSISPHTVKQYVTNIFEKLDVHSRVQAAVCAVRAGLV